VGVVAVDVVVGVVGMLRGIRRSGGVRRDQSMMVVTTVITNLISFLLHIIIHAKFLEN
jgi:hypothetical protein